MTEFDKTFIAGAVLQLAGFGATLYGPIETLYGSIDNVFLSRDPDSIAVAIAGAGVCFVGTLMSKYSVLREGQMTNEGKSYQRRE